MLLVKLMGNSLVRFYLWIFVLSIPFWLINPITEQFFYGIEVNLPISSLMAICPLVAAIILISREKGSQGIKSLMVNVFNPFRMKRKIDYFAIIILMPSLLLLSYIVMRMLEIPLPALDIQWSTIALLFVIFFMGAVCEETGWMGYAADPMINQWGPAITGTVMGTIWAIWHVVPYMQADHTLYWIAGQCLFTVALRVIMVIIYSVTNGSVLGSILIHTMYNVSWVCFPNGGSHYDPVITGMITAIAAITAVALWNKKTTG